MKFDEYNTKEEVVKLLEEASSYDENIIPEGASEEKIKKLLENLRIMPPELIEWLTICNAPIIGGGMIFFGVSPAPKARLIEWHYTLHPYWIEKKWIPIASDGCGNYYILDASKNNLDMRPLYFIDHEEGYDKPCYLVASELWFFIRFALEVEKKQNQLFPFNEDYMLQKDPGLRKYVGIIDLPWQV